MTLSHLWSSFQSVCVHSAKPLIYWKLQHVLQVTTIEFMLKCTNTKVSIHFQVWCLSADGWSLASRTPLTPPHWPVIAWWLMDATKADSNDCDTESFCHCRCIAVRMKNNSYIDLLQRRISLDQKIANICSLHSEQDITLSAIFVNSTFPWFACNWQKLEDRNCSWALDEYRQMKKFWQFHLQCTECSVIQ